jgi:hypothetical protein
LRLDCLTAIQFRPEPGIIFTSAVNSGLTFG